MAKLVPFTQDELRHLDMIDKHEALARYHEWLEWQRETDKRIERNIREKIWRVRNREKQMEIQRRNYEKNKIKKLAYAKEYNLKNKEKLKKNRHEYYLKNKERELQRNKEYYKEHKDEILQKQRENRRLNE